MTMCYNEVDIMPFWLDYYVNFIKVDKIIFYDGGSNDGTKELIKKCPIAEMIEQYHDKCDTRWGIDVQNNGWKKYKDDYDWMIVCDMDEFIYHPNLTEKLEDYKNKNITIPLIEGFDMISINFPKFEKGNYLPNLIKNGIKDPEYLNKNMIFNPKVVDINYRMGCHRCDPKGEVKFGEQYDIKLLQYKWLSYKYLTDKSKSKYERLSDWNLEHRAGEHYNKYSILPLKDYMKRYNSSINVIDNKIVFDCKNYIGDPEQLKIQQLDFLEYFMKNEKKIPYHQVINYIKDPNGIIEYYKYIILNNYSDKSKLLISYLLNKNYEQINYNTFRIEKDKDFYDIPLFSILTPTYERYDELKIAIDSVINQTYQNFEMIICSDGYDNQVENIIKEYNSEKIKYSFTEKTNDYGSTQRNYLTKISNGKYLIYLDDDNVIYQNCLQTIVDNLDSNTGMIIFKIDYDGLDHQLPIRNEIVLGKIDTLNIVVDKYYTKYAVWYNYVGHDYEFIKICENNILNHNKNIKFISNILGRHIDKSKINILGRHIDKSKIISKDVIIMTSHPNFKTSEDITKQALESLKPLNIDTILSTHCPISPDLQNAATHFLFDKNNPLIRHDYYEQSWFDKEDYYSLIKLHKNDNDLQHALAVYINYYNGILHAKSLGYKTAICTNFDIVFHEDDLNIIRKKVNEMNQSDKKSFYMTSNANEGIHYKTIFFITNIDFFIENFKYVTNENDYNLLTREVGSNTNCLENVFYQTLKSKSDQLLLQQIEEKDLFSVSKVNLFSNIEYFTILPLRNDNEHFVVWFSSSNSFDDNRDLKINMNDILIKDDLITKNYIFFHKVKFERDYTYNISCEINYNGNIKKRNIIINNESFDKLKENGEFWDKKGVLK